MDPDELQHHPTQQEQTHDGQGLAREPQGKTRGRPRKAAPGSHGFTLPAKPEVTEREKTDPRKFAVIPIRAITDKTITPTAFRILALVASYANRNGFTWVGQETLAQAMGITNQAISLHIVALKQAGYLEETAKAYWGGPTARCSTLRVVFDPSMSAEDVIARAGSADQNLVDSTRPLGSNSPGQDRTEASSGGEVVDSGRARTRPADTAAGLIAEVLARYRSEGLTPPTGHALEREAAMLASMRVRQGLSL